MKKSKLHLVSKFVVSLFLILGVKRTLISQTITITGPMVVGPGSQAPYQANITYTINPSSVITWLCTGGTIKSQNVTPGFPIDSVVQWGNVTGIDIIPPGGNIPGLGQVYILQNGKILTHQPSSASGSLTEFQFQLINSVWGCEELSPPTTVIYGLTFHPTINWMGFYKPNYTLNVSTP